MLINNLFELFFVSQKKIKNSCMVHTFPRFQFQLEIPVNILKLVCLLRFTFPSLFVFCVFFPEIFPSFFVKFFLVIPKRLKCPESASFLPRFLLTHEQTFRPELFSNKSENTGMTLNRCFLSLSDFFISVINPKI